MNLLFRAERGMCKMIKSIHFKNFKVLRDATLPLSRFTLIVGANGSGKSTAMQALSKFVSPSYADSYEIITADQKHADTATVSITIDWALDERASESSRKKIQDTIIAPTLPSDLSVRLMTEWKHENGKINLDGPKLRNAGVVLEPTREREILTKIASFRIFSFDAQAIAEPAPIRQKVEMSPNGSKLAGVLDYLHGSEPEIWEMLNEELSRWFPEFDRVLLRPTGDGEKGFSLRTRVGRHEIQAANLSHGTLLALAFLTLAYFPNPPAILCIEEPERGVHPRLFREIRDCMHRLCYPEEYGDRRDPVQVIATTHSPYMLDLYKDYPEEIVIAHKDERGVLFERLSDKPNFNEFLQDAPLGEVWYSGILGGVPLTS